MAYDHSISIIYSLFNLYTSLQVLISSLQLFHRETPLTVTLWYFLFVLTGGFMNIWLDLKLYTLALIWNKPWIPAGSWKFLTLYMKCIILKLTRSLNFNILGLRKNSFAGSLHCVLFTVHTAHFYRMKIGSVFVLCVFPTLASSK